MPTYTLAVYECDDEECDEAVIANTVAEARTQAAQRGWSVADTADIRCLRHRAYDICEECGRPMRPWGTPAALHPGTMARGSGGKCGVCTDRARRGKPDQVRKQDAKMEAAVGRYLSMSTEAFKDLFYGYPREREELARKAAPEDLWAALGL